MSRWVTFYHNLVSNVVSDLKVHKDKETALKYFNNHCNQYFMYSVGGKVPKLPASYGYPHRKYYGISARMFKERFDVTIDEALELAKTNREVKESK